MAERLRINNQIQAKELRVIGPQGENFGVMTRLDALSKAAELDTDLIEISPNSNPPIAKIMDYGKYQYIEAKKDKQKKTKSHVVEVKNVQIKTGTGENDLSLKAKKVSEWLQEGHRVKVDLFLPGRAKYLDEKFLKERMHRFFQLISEPFAIADSPKKSPKGMTAVVEKATKK
ncbi:MAG: translation initiation factor IF-3 [Minisyncoccia bacterium]